MLLILASVHKDYLVMKLKASINQRLAVLTPKISDQEHKDVACHKPLLESKEKLLQNSRPYPSKDWRAPSAQARVGWMNMKSR